MYTIGFVAFFNNLEKLDEDTRMKIALSLQSFSTWIVSDEAKGQVFEIYVPKKDKEEEEK